MKKVDSMEILGSLGEVDAPDTDYNAKSLLKETTVYWQHQFKKGEEKVTRVA